MYTIFSAVLRQQRKGDVMAYFGHSDRSAVYDEADSQRLTEWNSPWASVPAETDN
jgi:hypothetical protein